MQPTCLNAQEVEFLRGRDAGKNKIDFVDIASPSYRPEDNAGLDYDTVRRGQAASGQRAFAWIQDLGFRMVGQTTQGSPMTRCSFSRLGVAYSHPGLGPMLWLKEA